MHLIKKAFLCLVVSTISYSCFSQLEVGKSKAQLESEKPKRIGAKMSLLTPEYEVWAVDKDAQHNEYLRYEVVASNSIYHDINFSSLKEENDFYNYVFTLYDNFKDNEILLKNYKIVPHVMKLGGLNLIFDVYDSRTSMGFNTTVMISQKAWIKLFKDSKIHTLQ
jgi:hypothetical protein